MTEKRTRTPFDLPPHVAARLLARAVRNVRAEQARKQDARARLIQDRASYWKARLQEKRMKPNNERWELRTGIAAPCSCDQCKGRFVESATRELNRIAASRTTVADSDLATPPDPYAPVLARVNTAAAAIPEFEDRFKKERLMLLIAEHAVIAEEPSMRFTTAEELATAIPPNPYDEGLRSLRAKESR